MTAVRHRASTLRTSVLSVSRWVTLGAALLLAGPASAQRSEAQVEADIAFARGLAADWTFVDLAQQVLSETERAGVSGKLREELGVVTCEVFAVGARNERDDARRNALFLEAISAYKRFLEENPYSEYKAEAEADLVATASQYSTSVDIALESAAGEEADALRESKVAVLEDAVRLTQDLIDAITSVPTDERSSAQLRQLESLMLNRGLMMGNIGRSSKDGEYYFSRAQKALEDMVFEFGEGTPQALRAYKVLGDIFQWQNDPTSARYMYEGVVSQAWPKDAEAQEVMLQNNGGQPFTPDEMAVRYMFLELTTEGLLTSLMQTGETETACEYALHFYNTRQKFGLNWSVPSGYQSLLVCARTLLEAGGYVGGDAAVGDTRWFETEDAMKEAVTSRRQHKDAVSFALELADQVNRDNKGNVLQVRAQKLLSEIASRPGVQVSPSVLVEAAEGDFYAGEYDRSIAGFRRVLRRLEALDPSERVEYGARVMRFLGDCYRQSDRQIEAAMSYREGILSWQGDPEYDKQNASLYFGVMTNLNQRNTDDVVKQYLREAEDLYTKYSDSGGEDSIWFTRANKSYGEGDYSGAIDTLKKIPTDSDFYERALVKIHVSEFRAAAKQRDQAAVDRAVEGLDEYVEKYVKQNVVESERRKAKRTEALAEAEFFRGLGRSMKAKQTGELTLYQQVVDVLGGYGQRYSSQETLAPWALEMLVDAHMALGEIPEARKVVDEMVRDWRDNKRTAGVLKSYYKALVEKREASKDPAEQEKILREMAGFLKIANEVGTPDFQSYRNESKHWMDLGEYTEALRISDKLIDTFGDKADYADNMSRYVLPDHGSIQLELGMVAEAKETLTPLVTGAGAKPSKQTLLDWSRSISGWLVGGQPGEAVKEVAGAGGTEAEWQLATEKLDSITRAGDKWTSCEWYEQKLMFVYAYYAWATADSRKMESAKNQFSQIDITLQDPTYAAVENFCKPGQTSDDPAVLKRLGSGVLQARYQYMANKLR